MGRDEGEEEDHADISGDVDDAMADGDGDEGGDGDDYDGGDDEGEGDA